MMMGSVSERTDEVAAERVVVLLRHSYGELRRFAAVAAPSEMAPDDLVHDAIVSVLRSNGFDGVELPVAYLKRTMLNLASNERRRLGRRRRAVLRLEREARDVDDAYPSDLAHLDELSPNERTVLYLHYVEGDPFETIAQDLGMRTSSVRQTATRARRSLRRLNGADDDQD